MDIIAGVAIGFIAGFIFCLILYDEEITKGMSRNICKNIYELRE